MASNSMEQPERHPQDTPSPAVPPKDTVHSPAIPDSSSESSSSPHSVGATPAAASSPATPAPRLLIPFPLSLVAKPGLVLADFITEASDTTQILAGVGNVDMVLAADGSYVDTASGAAARVLKKYLDQQYGVGVQVKSPYAVTGFINQHGQQRYRVGLKDQTPPGASAPERQDPGSVRSTLSNASTDSYSPNTKRRSRMSLHFLPPGIFKNSVETSRPLTAVVQGSGTNRARKTRSIPDLASLGDNSERNSIGTIGTTGRGHSQSLTSADAPRHYRDILPDILSPRRGDVFGRLMDWYNPVKVDYSNVVGSSVSFDRSRFLVSHPFGLGITFDSPSLKLPPASLIPPRQLQEKHSFESTMTARQSDTLPSGPAVSKYSSHDDSITRPASVIDLRSSSVATTVSGTPPEKSEDDKEYELSPDVNAFTQYHTSIFDVLQTYRGLPLLDRFSPEIEDTTIIKISLDADESAAPRDDPRFVIWGELQPEVDHDDQSTSRDSLTDGSTGQSSNFSRRRNSKAKPRVSDVFSSSSGVGTALGRKVLLAATIERWIAQLTSDLNYDELLNFFLTYRTYVTAIDLCQLLICRFHWALQKPSSLHDEKVRRIVRVRTFVAIRYWLLTFFTVDFVPNRDLRILISGWLNTLHNDPVLKKNVDGLGIVKRLIKTAKECKATHVRVNTRPKTTSPRRSIEPQEHVLGKSFAKIVTEKAMEQGEDSDLDLDFLPEEARVPEHNANDIANMHISVATKLTSGLANTRPSTLPISSMNILHRADLSPGASSNSEQGYTQVPPHLPIHQSALSRAFVKTIGRLGRFKRLLNSRSVNRSPINACADVSAFDLDLNVSKDLLSINGGVEKYLESVEARTRPAPKSTSQSPSISSASRNRLSLSPRQRPRASIQLNIPNAPPLSSDLSGDGDPTPVISHFIPSVLAETAPVPHDNSPPPDYETSVQSPSNPPGITTTSPQLSVPDTTTPSTTDVGQNSSNDIDRPTSMLTTSTESFGIPLSELGQPPTFPRVPNTQWQFDIASLDDLDLSDESSDANIPGPSAPPGLRKAARKLPLRRDFEFVPRPETVSSLGITSRTSVVSGPSSSSMSSASYQGLGGNIQQWQMNALVDSLSDEEEPGDVEAALRRLEGHINPERQQEKVSKVNGWVRTIQQRMAVGDYSEEEPRFPVDSDDEGDTSSSVNEETESQRIQSASTPPTSDADNSRVAESLDVEDSPTSDNYPSHQIPPPPGLEPPTSSGNAEVKPSLEDVVPLEIIQSRMPASGTSTEPDPVAPISRFGNSYLPRVHRSFILGVRAETLAQHFSMIDRELFISIKFEELVLDDWAGTEEIDVLDWTVYLKDRARWKAENRHPEKTSALAAVRGRFNLMVNFVISEVLLTQPSERHVIVGKFVRIAWKCYGQSNFHSLTAILTALQSEWVSKAMRKSSWHRIGIFEARVLKDLKMFTSNVDGFKFMRKAVDAITEAKALETGAASVASGSGIEGKNKYSDRSQLSSCIPFIGVYLYQLQQLAKLPDLIDPTAPHQAVGVNPDTNAFDPLAQPEVFSSLAPLPPSVHLEPLINVHKQRRIAFIIKSLVTGQHLASRVQFSLDKKIFHRCLRLRALDSLTLRRILSMHPD